MSGANGCHPTLIGMHILDTDLNNLTLTPDALHVTGDTLEAITRTAVSPSTSNTFHDSCPARWAAEQVVSVPHDGFSPANVGTAAHTVLERLYLKPPAERTEHEAMRELIDLSHNEYPDDETTRGLWLSAVAEKYRGIFNMENPEDINVLYCEPQLDGITIDGIPFNGFIDRIDEVNGSARIVDYKTGNFRKPNPAFFDGYAQQVRLYAIAAREKLGVDPRTGYLFYTAEGRKHQVAIAKKHLNEAKRIYVKASEKLFTCQETGEFPTKVSGLCSWCPLVEVCPSAKREGMVAKVDVPPITELAPIVDVSVTPGGVGADNTVDDIEIETVVDTPLEALTPTETKEKPVPQFCDDKPYVEDSYGAFNLGSYAAGAVFTTVATALEEFHKSGFEYDRDELEALAVVLSDIFSQVQERMVEDVSWQAGSHTRIRHLFFTLVRTELPIPFGEGGKVWETWHDVMIERILELAESSILLYNEELMSVGEAFNVLNF